MTRFAPSTLSVGMKLLTRQCENAGSIGPSSCAEASTADIAGLDTPGDKNGGYDDHTMFLVGE